MSSFKSPQLHLCGRIKQIIDCQKQQESSFYVKAQFVEGEDWRLLSGNSKMQSFEAETSYGVAAVQHPFNIHYISQSVRGWPRLLLEVWKVDSSGRHKIYGYGTAVMPMEAGDHSVDVCCWRPSGAWYDRVIGANPQLQHPGIIASSLSRYGLKTVSSCIAQVQVAVICRNFQLHGVLTKNQ